MGAIDASSSAESADLKLRLPKRLAIVTSQAFSLINFRGSLIRELVNTGVTVLTLAPDFTDDMRAEVRRLGAEPVDFSLSRTGLNPIADAIDVLKLIRQLKALEPDATLAYFIKPVIFGTLAAWIARIPHRFVLIEGLGFVFIEGHGRSRRRTGLRKLVALLYKWALAKAERVILLNSDDIEELVSIGVLDRRKAVLVPGIGVDLHHFSPSAIEPKPAVFVLVARMLRSKGVCEFVNAARQLKLKYPFARFLLVGGTDANPESIADAQLSFWHRDGYVEWFGHIPDIREVVARASVFVLPSYREGLPRSTQEAMAMGKAILTTDVPGCRDTVNDGENGFLIPVRDSSALAAAMERFILNPHLAVKMGVASRQLAETRYDQRTLNRMMLNVLTVT